MVETQLDLVVAGTADAVLMVESEAKELNEDIMLGAVMFGHRHFQPVIKAIIELAEKAAKEPREVKIVDESALEKEMLGLIEQDLRSAYAIPVKQDRYAAVGKAKEKVMAHYFPEGQEPKYDKLRIAGVFKELEAKIVRWNILDTGKRIDGRDPKTVRNIIAEVGVLPRAHGSALFTRGETQAMVVTTLGTGEDEQYIDALSGTYKETFLLHYNFPPYSVGETGRLGGTKRREIGHGKLAWRAIHPVLPPHHEFPYTVRVVSEITESNGSSSMASVCGASLALMDAGVPLKRPTAGIAMGLILEGSALCGAVRHPRRRGSSRRHGLQGGRHRPGHHLAADGHQDRGHHRGDHEGRARPGQGRAHPHPRRNGQGADQCRAPSSANTRRASRPSRSPTDKIREVIGTGGKVIREIVEKTGAKVNIEDDGTVKVASNDGEAMKAAIKWIKSIASDPEIGQIYEGTVVKVMEFGAFVNFFGAKDGLVHISQLAFRPRAEDLRRRQGRRQGQGQAARLRRSRQDAAVDEGGRPGDRRGPRGQAEGGSPGAARSGRRVSHRCECERQGRLNSRPFCCLLQYV